MTYFSSNWLCKPKGLQFPWPRSCGRSLPFRHTPELLISHTSSKMPLLVTNGTLRWLAKVGGIFQISNAVFKPGEPFLSSSFSDIIVIVLEKIVLATKVCERFCLDEMHTTDTDENTLFSTWNIRL